MPTIQLPQPGQIVRLRTRTHLVEDVQPHPGYGTTVRVACLDDDAQGLIQEVAWELELDREILDTEAWKSIGEEGFDNPRHFAAFLNTLRWNCVTATNPNLFQSPFRAGIKLEAFQLEPLRKALRLPRVNIFIADGVGTGKTIMAGLIGVELLLRKRINEIIIACPPSMIPQWRDEMESRFGLTFEVLDRAFIERIRVERGYGVNPWETFPRFLVSHNLLIDENYAAPLRNWLDNLRPGSLLILDEAHHAAPASGAKYAIDSRFTRAIRDLGPRFEHRVFLSATPHNGHSNSFSALLELLDSQRFTRGVKVTKANLNAVMVRRLKDDIREVCGGFPKRVPVQIDIAGVPEDSPELLIPALLDEYRSVRAQRLEDASKKKQNQAALLITNLQQRLLSSAEAFARTLRVHKRTMERVWKEEGIVAAAPGRSEFLKPLGSDDERAELAEDEITLLEDQAIDGATSATSGDSTKANATRERELLDEMQGLADQARSKPDGKIRKLIEWMRENMCPGVQMPGEASVLESGSWTNTRIIIFTEWQDTKRYVSAMLRQAIAGTDQAELRLVEYHGLIGSDKREAIKKAFNEDPAKNPLRILIATDAAREGLNLQAHCHNLFHFDVPWNPSRLEQRNGRIDRKLQPSPEVYCHYFVYTQRPEDRILQTLVRKSKTILEELGSLSPVLESRLEKVLENGIVRKNIGLLEDEINALDMDPEAKSVVEEELEASRERQQELVNQIESLRRTINTSKEWLGFDGEQFRDALSCSLEILKAKPLEPVGKRDDGLITYNLPDIDTRLARDPSWAPTLDTLRALPDDGKKDFNWRKQAPIRPVVFQAPNGIDDEIVQLHLEHRLTKRLLSRFLSQGFVHHDLSRACLAQSEDAIPRVILLGRLALYGEGAARLHEEVLTVTARWIDPIKRDTPLKPYGRDGEAKTLRVLHDSLGPSSQRSIPEAIREKLQETMVQDIEQLLQHLTANGEAAREDAEKKLTERGRIESDEMRRILEEQRKRVLKQFEVPVEQLELQFDTDKEARRQRLADRKAHEQWLARYETDILREPARILDHYKTRSWRIEPVGVAYLWPVTG